MSKILKNKAEKYTSLISSAFELFKDKGINDVSIDEIVKKAGVAKGTFYLYFKDKFDLISQLILKKASEFLNIQADIPDITTDEDFFLHLENYIEYLVEFLEKNKALTVLIDKNISVCVNAIVHSSDGPIRDLYNKILLYFENKGFPREEVETKMYLYITMTISSCCSAILRNEPNSLDKIKPYLYSIIADSIKGSAQNIKKRLDND